MSVNVCYYCGEPADSIDHVVPLSLIRQLEDDPEALERVIGKGRIREVDACRDCNHRLSSEYDINLKDRKERLRDRLRSRYLRLLAMPEWTDDDLGELNGWLQGSVIHATAVQAWIMRRLSYEGRATLNGMVIGARQKKSIPALIREAKKRKRVKK